MFSPSLLTRSVPRFAGTNSPFNQQTPDQVIPDLGIENTAPVDPKYLQAITDVYQSARTRNYSREDDVQELKQVLERQFGDGSGESIVFALLPSGTAANFMSMAPALQDFEAVIASDISHVMTREAGALHHQTGAAIYPIPNQDGKLTVDAVSAFIDAHNSKGNQTKSIEKVISISQPTELGTVYSDDEVRALAELAHKNNMLIQMDGARLPFVAAKTGKSMKALTTDLGVDMLYIGATRLNMLNAELAIFLPDFFKNQATILQNSYLKGSGELIIDKYFFEEVILRRKLKRSGLLTAQVAGTARQLVKAFDDDYMIKQAEKAIHAAESLGQRCALVSGVTLWRPVDSNAVFLSMPKEKYRELKDLKVFRNLKSFYKTDPDNKDNTVFRLLTHPMISPESMNYFVATLTNLMADLKESPTG